VSDTTLDVPPLESAPAASDHPPPPEPWTLRQFAREHPGWASAIALVLVSGGLVIYAGTRPSFDAYGWLVWGHQTLAGSLNTNAAPSWKPLPYLFTLPYALLGRDQLWLWMITVVAASLGGSLAAARIAYRLTLDGGRRWAAGAAGAFAAVALLDIQDWWHYVLSAQSDTIVAALCLGALDCHLSRHPRWAFGLGTLAALARPEVWPFLGLYSLWAWRARPAMRWLIIAGAAAVVLLWFGIPALTSRSPFVAAANAFGSGRRLRSDRVLGTIDRFLALCATPLELAALLCLGWAVVRRERVLLALAGGVVVWVAVEIGFALHGWPGLGRYMFGAAALMVVLAAVLLGRLLAVASAGPWASGSAAGVPGSPPRPRRSTAAAIAARAGAAALAAALIVSLIPAAASRIRAERHDLHLQRLRTHEIELLAAGVARLGGPRRLRACGEPLTRLEYQTVVAWTLQRNVAAVGFKYPQAIRRGNPIVLYTPIPTGGWMITPLHQRPGACPAVAPLVVR